MLKMRFENFAASVLFSERMASGGGRKTRIVETGFLVENEATQTVQSLKISSY